MTKTIKIETHLTPPQKEPIRLQEYGVGIFTTLTTKSALKKALKKKHILVDLKIASTATFIRGGETIYYNKPLEKSIKKNFKIDLEVVFQDDYLAIINKPAGILVSGNSFKTIDNALESNLTKSSLPDATKPRPVHRLDFPTTGLLVIGKTTASILLLNKLFENKEIAKTYLAVTQGVMPTEGSINTEVDNKVALSHYSVLNRIVSKKFKFLNLVKLTLTTGRKHQLRTHLAGIGNPILGDAQYGIAGQIVKGKGLYLHAYSLEFTHPFTNEKIKVTKELSTKYTKLFPSFLQNQ
ncbi:RluA family pseudouridine synthase [Cellulophaga sp. F20128]|uniref:RluA family pseudouridine synthase n=1 Tax=Cellulophaga sp. F20128 TaxID=2926413 RepID=UPI001FF3AA4E|nr:RluA family pseudouridine synthase [Cellulophaga sp. F20128]MCK0158684.1 RluA family pseudouridine synthase [Cellulophaga sp. F20128]